MNLGKRIAILFIANHVEQFNETMEGRGYDGFQLNLDYIGTKVMDTSNIIRVNPQLILHKPYVNFKQKQPIPINNNTANKKLLEALDNSKFKGLHRKIVISGCQSLSDDYIEHITNSINLLGTTGALGILNLINQYNHHDDYIDLNFMMALFIIEDQDDLLSLKLGEKFLFDNWLLTLNAKNKVEKKDLITDWAREQIKIHRVLHELFYEAEEKVA